MKTGENVNKHTNTHVISLCLVICVYMQCNVPNRLFYFHCARKRRKSTIFFFCCLHRALKCVRLLFVRCSDISLVKQKKTVFLLSVRPAIETRSPILPMNFLLILFRWKWIILTVYNGNNKMETNLKRMNQLRSDEFILSLRRWG